MEKILEIRQIIQNRSASARKPDRDARRLLLYVFTATRGGYTRLQIISHLSERPMNTNQLALEMKIDYKAVQHHLEILEKNNLVARTGEKYGVTFHLSNYLEANILALDEVITKLERQLSRKIVYY
ncbi:MAG TPA: winged helix-turn-helix domain-containing protein [Candidatus Nitrosotenuis sp.]|nr:winged helix-turn-helix domain-containing protein [Candidatus Nitrosotenuis sp.]